MATFNRMDICAAHYVFAVLHNGDDRAAAKFARLSRIGYKPSTSVEFCNLQDNALEIALELGLSFADVTRLKVSEVGTVVSGTLSADDLLSEFADRLESLVQDNAEHWCGRTETRDAHVAAVWEARELLDDACVSDTSVENLEPELASEALDKLMECLGYYAPAGCVFGAHEGDGSDFGFWTSSEHRCGCADCDHCAA